MSHWNVWLKPSHKYIVLIYELKLLTHGVKFNYWLSTAVATACDLNQITNNVFIWNYLYVNLFKSTYTYLKKHTKFRLLNNNVAKKWHMGAVVSPFSNSFSIKFSIRRCSLWKTNLYKSQIQLTDPLTQSFITASSKPLKGLQLNLILSCPPLRAFVLIKKGLNKVQSGPWSWHLNP